MKTLKRVFLRHCRFAILSSEGKQTTKNSVVLYLRQREDVKKENNERGVRGRK